MPETEPDQDTSHVARVWTTVGQGGLDTDEVSQLASRVHVLDAALNLGVILDSQLLTSAQVSAVCRNGYYQLQQLRPLVRCLSENSTKIPSILGWITATRCASA